MEALNPKLLEFFTANYKPGIIGVVGTKDTIGLAIREAERALTADGQASLWSHCFILGDLRFDRRGPGGMKSKSPTYLNPISTSIFLDPSFVTVPRKTGLVNGVRRRLKMPRS